MLIFSDKRLVPTDVNMMVIRAKDNEGFFYIHRSLYDQAVIIDDIYGECPDRLRNELVGSQESRSDVQMFLEKAPSPINILGNFLLLIKEPLDVFEDMVGAIHVMSGPVNLRKMLKVPFSMRNTPSFSLTIKEEYQLAWDRFFQNTMEYTTDMFMPKQIAPMNGVQTTTVPDDDELSAVGEDGVEYEDPLEALLFGCGDIFGSSSDEDEEEVAEEEPVAPAPVVQPTAPAPAPVIKPTAPEVVEPIKEDGLSVLKLL